MKSKPHRTLLLAGLGNTGSHLAPLIARGALCDILVLVDPDVVEQNNMQAQAYGPDDVGHPKASAMARRLAALGLPIVIRTFVGELEDMPVGLFGDTVVLCLDHDAARQVAAERAWLMSATLYDVAVNAKAGLARVTCIAPVMGRACLECGFSDQQFENLLARHSCRKTPPTNAPAALGSFAASVAAMQLRNPALSDFNNEIVAAPGTGEMWVTRLTQNKTCRFNHASPTIECLNIEFSAPFESIFSQINSPTVEVLGTVFARKWRCVGCGIDDDYLKLARVVGQPCSRCGAGLESLPFYSLASVCRSDIPSDAAPPSLEAVGLRPGDVVRTNAARYVQLGELPDMKPTSKTN